MGKAVVVANHCKCHPETCCCNDWVVLDKNGKRYCTFFSLKTAQEIAELLNEKDIIEENKQV